MANRMSSNSVPPQPPKRKSSLHSLVSKLRQLKTQSLPNIPPPLPPQENGNGSPIRSSPVRASPTKSPTKLLFSAPPEPPRRTILDDLLVFEREGVFIPQVWHTRSIAITGVQMVGEYEIEFKLYVLHGQGPRFDVSLTLEPRKPWILESCLATCSDFSYLDPRFVDETLGVVRLPMEGDDDAQPGWLPHYPIAVLVFLLLRTLRGHDGAETRYQFASRLVCPFPYRDLALRAGTASLQGRRPSMEDHVLLQPPWQQTQLFGVFDGHGGSNTALSLSQKIPLLFDSFMYEFEPKDGRALAVGKALKQALDSFDRELINNTLEISGSTACVAAVDLRSLCLTVANVGDSRAVLCRQGQALDLSIDHKAEHPYEVARILDQGGFVSRGRAMGILAVSRAIGDRDIKRYGELTTPIVCDADVDAIALNPQMDEFLLLACDGLFDVMSSQEAITFARSRLAEGMSAEQTCQALAAHAIHVLGSMDNVSIVLVTFSFALHAPTSAPPSMLPQQYTPSSMMNTPLKSTGSGNVLRAARASALKRASSQKRIPGIGEELRGAPPPPPPPPMLPFVSRLAEF